MTLKCGDLLSNVGFNFNLRHYTPGYLDKIAEATKDIDVQLVFNNAGFMLTGGAGRGCRLTPCLHS